MPQYDKSIAKHLNYKVVAASQTTSQISNSGNDVPGKDYLERIHVIHATTAVGAVTLFDGGTTLLAINAPITGSLEKNNVITYELGILAQTTKGFNITTGASVSVLVIGNW